jgi:hypothetical protein
MKQHLCWFEKMQSNKKKIKELFEAFDDSQKVNFAEFKKKARACIMEQIELDQSLSKRQQLCKKYALGAALDKLSATHSDEKTYWELRNNHDRWKSFQSLLLHSVTNEEEK